MEQQIIKYITKANGYTDISSLIEFSPCENYYERARVNFVLLRYLVLNYQLMCLSIVF